MRRIKLAVLSVVAACGLSVTAAAQITTQPQSPMMLPGTVDTLPLTNQIIIDSINTSNMRTAGGAAAGKGGRRAPARKPTEVVRGEAVIAAGKATTTFTPTEAGLQAFLKLVQWDADTKEPAKQREYVQQLLGQFNQMMQERGYVLNDSNDAHILAFEIANNIRFSIPAEKSDLAIMRRDWRQDFLKNAYYQGMTDVQKQVEYLKEVMLAMQAHNYTERAKAARTEQERESLKAKALENAMTIFKGFFSS